MNSEINLSARQVERDGNNLDFKRVLFRAIRYWYVIALSLLIAFSIAFINNRYSPRVYPVTASIIIRETEETGGAGELLYKNALIDPYRNYLNELYIIKSYPLITSVLQDLNFSTSFYKKGNVLTSEVFGDLPFEVKIINPGNIKSFSALFTVLNDREYELAPVDADNKRAGQVSTFRFDETVSYNNVQLVFKSVPGMKITALGDTELIFNYTDPSLLAGSYVGRLSANWAEKGAGVINLAVVGTNPQKDLTFMQGLIQRYQAFDLERKNIAASRTIEFINDQLADITDSLHQVESLMERFKGKNVVTDLSAEASRLYEKLQGVELQKTEMAIRSHYNQYLIDYIQKDRDLDQIILPTSVGLGDNILTQLIQNMVTVQLELKRMINQDKLENPLVRERKRRLDEIKNSIIESVANQQKTDQIKNDYIGKQIKSIEKQLSGLPAAERQYISISRNYSLLENLYIFLLQKRAEAGISRASTTSDVQIVNEPIQGGAISPKPMQNYLMALALGLFIPVLAFIVFEYLNNRVQSKEDIEKLTSVPFIGGLGHKKSDDNRAVISSPKSGIAESFRALRSNLNYFIKEKSASVIMVTSSISGEGKTFTTINLATVIAFAGKRTLIVGADLRRPKIFQDFNLNNDKGLSSFLAGLLTLDQIIQKTDVPNLDVVSGGPMPPNPSELIMRPAMQQFFDETRKRYDYIIIDTPPIAVVADAFILSEFADHSLFVTRQNYTPKDLVKAVNEFYETGRLKNMSVILNDIYRSGPGYGYGSYYNYGYGYGYGYLVKKKGEEYYHE